MGMIRRGIATRIIVVAAIVALLGVGGALVAPRLLGGDGPRVPRFVDETATAGVDLTYGGDSNYDTGGGVAVTDCDGDGRLDLYVAAGAGPAGLFHNDSPTGGALRFHRIASPVTDLTGVLGAYPLDIDGDGRPDLAVLRSGPSVLLRGLGDCRFEDATARWGAAPPAAWATAFSATWERETGLPTLAFGTYVVPDSGSSAGYLCSPNELLRPDAAGTRYAPPASLDPAFCPLSMLFSDWDGSGRRDLRVSNDRQYYDNRIGEEQLWRMVPGEPPRLYGAADGWQSLQIWGMGIASQDLTGDGLPELYLTSQGDNKLQTLSAGPSRPTYRDMALATGVIGTHPATGGDPLPSTAWHPEFDDVDNDGVMDLYVSKGNVDRLPDFAAKDPSDLFLGRSDGTFTNQSVAAGIANFDRTRGAALVDLNDDGLLDLVEVKLAAPFRVWRNVGAGSATAPAPMGHWLAVRPSQPGANRDAIGAVVEVRIGGAVTRRELTIGGGHASGELGWVHFGLGTADGADVRVTWPDGTTGPWQHVTADRFVAVSPGAEPAPWTPPGP